MMNLKKEKEMTEFRSCILINTCNITDCCLICLTFLTEGRAHKYTRACLHQLS